MPAQGSRRILLLLGCGLAAAVLVFYLAFRHNSSTKPGASGTAGSNSSTPREGETGALATQQLLHAASPGLVLIEVFDGKGHARASGSGFVASSDGAIVTNYHVIRGASRAVARFADRGSSEISGVAAYDTDRDVAVLRAAGAVPKALTLANSDEVKVGQRLVAIGSSPASQNATTEALVGGVSFGMIQMNAPIRPGSSGGPVLNARGEVVGIAVAGAPRGENLNFAVPINWAKRYLGSSVAKSLADVAKENTMTNSILDGTVSIAAGQSQSWQAAVNSNFMSSPELQVSFQAEGAATDSVRVRVLQDQKLVYDSGLVNHGAFRLALPADGIYTVVLDNRDSLTLGRNVQATVSLRYVK